MERETVFFSENVPLLATIGYPDEGEGPFPAVVILHGHARHRNDGLDALSRYLNDAGYITLRFDFRGCGETMYERYNIICHTHCPEDAQNAVSFLMVQPEVDPNRIGITGESLGGCTTIWAAATDPRVRCAVSMAAPGDIERNLRRAYSPEKFQAMLDLVEKDRYERVCTGHSRFILSSAVGDRSEDEAYQIACDNTNDRIWGMANSNYMTLASFESMLKYKPETQCGNISIPILYLHGEEDELVDPSEARSLYENTTSEKKELRILPGLDHNIPLNPRRQEAFDYIVSWFDAFLR